MHYYILFSCINTVAEHRLKIADLRLEIRPKKRWNECWAAGVGRIRASSTYIIYNGKSAVSQVLTEPIFHPLTNFVRSLCISLFVTLFKGAAPIALPLVFGVGKVNPRSRPRTANKTRGIYMHAHDYRYAFCPIFHEVMVVFLFFFYRDEFVCICFFWMNEVEIEYVLNIRKYQ